MRSAASVALLSATSSAKVYFHESFDNMDKWVQSESKSDYGKFVLSSGEAFTGDKAINQGLKTSEDAHFYSASTELPDGITNKDKTLVVSLSVKHEQGIDCGGGYLKIGGALPDQKKFDGDSDYYLMLGPDKCGSTSKIHAIFGSYKTKGNNLLWKKEPSFPDDKLTHVYTLVVKSDNTYEMYVDQEMKESGSLEEDWEFLKPKEIDDPEDKKPEDWVDEAKIADPEDKKPSNWDDEPEKIVDSEATQPEDWDTEDDGEWEAPMIANPKHQGDWSAKMIDNAAYKGEWSPKRIANPDYVDDKDMYLAQAPLKYVGVDIWQVKAGTIFDNIIVGDNLDEVNAIIDKTWKATKDAESDALKAIEKVDEEKAAAERAESDKKDAEADEEAAKEDEAEDSKEDL